jgi:hypothetical protein
MPVLIVKKESSNHDVVCTLNAFLCPTGLPSSGSGGDLATTTYYTTQEISSSPKYHQESTTVGTGGGGGHDNFTDFVTLVCQTTATTQESGSGRSPAKVVSYYTTAPATSAAGMFPAQPMARPVPLRIPGACEMIGDKFLRDFI